MPAPPLSLVYITCASNEEAKTIGRALVEERLAACVNIFGGPQSIYRWQGKVEEAEETLLIAKTTPAQFARLEQRVRELHSYDVPCILSLSAEALNKAYAEWVAKETSAS